MIAATPLSNQIAYNMQMNDWKRLAIGYGVGWIADAGTQFVERISGDRTSIDWERPFVTGWFYAGSSVMSGGWADKLRAMNQPVTWRQTDGLANSFRLFPQSMINWAYRYK